MMSKKRYRVLSLVGDEIEAENAHLAAAAFIERGLRNKEAIMRAALSQMTVVDLDSRERTVVSYKELVDSLLLNQVKARKLHWPRWWELILLIIVASTLSAIDAMGEAGGEWWWKFGVGLLFYLAVVMSGFMTASITYYLIKTKGR